MKNEQNTIEHQNSYYGMVHDNTVRDLRKLEGIAHAAQMNIAVAEFVADSDNVEIMWLQRVILTDHAFCLSTPNSRTVQSLLF